MSKVVNSVRTEDARTSNNFFKSDLILQHYLATYLTPDALDYMTPNLNHLGEKAALEMDELSQKADKNSPVLKKRDRWGNDCSTIKFHPSYWKLLDIAAESNMIHVKYEPNLRKQFAANTHMMGFAAGQVYAMSELGIYCPLCMTDGAAYLVDRYAPRDVKQRILPRLASQSVQDLYTGAMYLTEKSGGSDVGRNLTTARHVRDDLYHLEGEKWFCSNANADIIMALARTGTLNDGIRGLSLFLIEQAGTNTNDNKIKLVRLKEKLGVRSMATGEVIFNNTEAKILSSKGKGFNVMADMINISRLYNAVAALSGARRGLIEAYQYLNHRIIFGKTAIKHTLIREKLTELGSLHLANQLLVWRAIRAMDKSEHGDGKEAQLLRMLIPMAKWWSAEHAVYMVRECMELMGGNGYIEDFVMPKLLRDVNVLPIWEGSGNVIVLDIMRALKKSDGLNQILNTIKEETTHLDDDKDKLKIATRLEAIEKTLSKLFDLDKEQAEATAKPLFKQLIHLYQIGLMLEYHDSTSSRWVDPALTYMLSAMEDDIEIREPMATSRIHDLIAWDY